MFKMNHYFAGDEDLNNDFENALRMLMDRMCHRLRIGNDETRLISEELILIDHTPVGNVDSLVVAEAIMGNRSTETIIDIEAPGAMARLRNTMKRIEEVEDSEEELVEINKGIGYAKMRELCETHGNGMVVIRKGVMERTVRKTMKADVILDEDLDHFYLNGINAQDGGKVVSKM